MGNVEHQHLEFIISDKETLSKEEDYLSSGLGFVGRLLKIDPSEYTESNKTITRELKPDRNTKGEERVFYIHPVDPKLRSAGVIKVPSTHYNKGSFSLLVWDEPTGIEVFKAEDVANGEKSFEIHKQNDGAYQSKTIQYGTNGYVFYVRTKPEYANPNYLEWKTEKVSGNYMCIQNPECSSAPDENGRWRFKFNTNTNNSWGKKDMAQFLFSIKVLNPKVVSEKHDLDPPVTNYLLIKSN